eukprot:gene7617-11940_t
MKIENKTKNQKKEIIIIGSGMAGVSTARHLQSKLKEKSTNFNITILEGRERVGGRMWTTHFQIKDKKIPVDLGATWVEGPRSEEIQELCKKFGINLVDSQSPSLYLDSKNENVNETYVNKMYKIFQKHMEIAMERPNKDTTVRIALERYFKETGQDFEDKELLQFFLNQIELFEGGSIDEISAWSLDDSDNEDEPFGIVKEGYGTLLEKYSKGLNIKLNHIVTHVDYSNSNEIRVITNQGLFKADIIVCTIPLGCLKNETIQFYPKLPEKKLNVIKKMGMGVLDKTVLEFPFIFWDEKLLKLNHFWKPKHREIEEFFCINDLHKGSPIIVAYYSASFAKEVELLNDQQTVEKVLNILKEFYGKDIPNPLNYFITRWNRDPFARGSYSFDTVGLKEKDHDILGEPIENRLFFAGEASTSKSYSFVNGAYLSGKRDAKRISKLF